MKRNAQQKELLQKVINWLAEGAPHVEINDKFTLEGFFYGDWIDTEDEESPEGREGTCGTFACIAGAAVQFNAPEKLTWDNANGFTSGRGLTIEEEARELLGLTKIESKLLFYPFNMDSYEMLEEGMSQYGGGLTPLYWVEDLPPQKIAVVLQHFNDTGEINWDLVEKPKK